MSTSTTSIIEMAALVQEIDSAICNAKSEVELLGVVSRYLERLGAHCVRRFAPSVDATGSPAGLELVCSWHRGELPSTPSQRQSHPLQGPLSLSLPLPTEWTEQATNPVVISDVLTDCRVGDPLARQCDEAGARAIVFLPLYSRSHRSWEGMLIVGWQTVHTPTSEEMFLFTLLQQAVASTLGHRHTDRIVRQTVNELGQMYVLSDQLNAAATLSTALEAAALPAVSRGATTACLWVWDGETPLKAQQIVTLAAHFELDREVGEESSPSRVSVEEEPLLSLLAEGAESVLLLEDIRTDERLDPAVRLRLQAMGQYAAVVMPLIRQRRLLGALRFTWPTAQRFMDRDQRLYQSIARAAATTLENRLLVQNMERLAHASAEQATIFRLLLEHLPVGVWVAEAPSGRSTLANRQAVKLLGESVTPAAVDSPRLRQLEFLRPGTEQVLVDSECPNGQTLEDGKFHAAEVDVVSPDGHRQSLLWSSAPVLGEDGKLRGALSCLTDITQRRLDEIERQRMQQELIKSQGAALDERSIPLIPIAADIVVVPLIGAIDKERGRQLMDTVLDGASRLAARVVLMDVTGVKGVDAEAAVSLGATGRALQLLGVEPVLTGIRAETAQTLIQLGVNLDGIVTRNSLQKGVTYALRRLGRQAIV